MTAGKKSTDAGLSNAERKDLRSREAKEAIADHEQAQRASNANRERLREERLAREAAAGPMVAPAPELPDDTPIERIFPARIQNDPNEAYEVVPIEPGPHGPPKGWWTVKRNGLRVKHFPGKEKARRYATDPEYRASLVIGKAWEKAKRK
jgi:hypothetical protein